jgi:hypothetical protein
MSNQQDSEQLNRILCNVMINTQQLIEDLDILEEHDMINWKLQKLIKATILPNLEKFIGEIYGPADSEQRITFTQVYDASIFARGVFEQLDLNSRLQLSEIIINNPKVLKELLLTPSENEYKTQSS